MPWTGNATKLI
jgi:hypothetical protein